LVEAGLPGYRRELDKSLAAIGKTRADVKAVMLTHGHIDHIGMAATLAAGGAMVHLHPADIGLAAHPETNTLQTRGSNKNSDVAMQSLERLAGIEASPAGDGQRTGLALNRLRDITRRWTWLVPS
jgi:glyoxylase-like metal-dependent hydrolase (beta-lactamase superfamily II)